MKRLLLLEASEALKVLVDIDRTILTAAGIQAAKKFYPEVDPNSAQFIWEDGRLKLAFDIKPKS